MTAAAACDPSCWYYWSPAEEPLIVAALEVQGKPPPEPSPSYLSRLGEGDLLLNFSEGQIMETLR